MATSKKSYSSTDTCSPRYLRKSTKRTDSMLLFKILILKKLYALSDDTVEYRIRDRLSLHSKISDAETVCLFVDTLAQALPVETFVPKKTPTQARPRRVMKHDLATKTTQRRLSIV